MKKALVIGSGFASMSAASFLAKAGWQVTVVEQHSSPGGRARQWQAQGYRFDMGPSWYWMPDVFERYFAHFNKCPQQYYHLVRLDPSYQVFFKNETLAIPASFDELTTLVEKLEPGAGKRFIRFMEQAAHKYKLGMQELVYKPGLHPGEYAHAGLLLSLLRMQVLSPMKKHIGRYVKNKQLQQILEFPILFLGATATQIPALYSLMNYADAKLGTWYPMGGMYKIVEAMYSLAREQGVQFEFDNRVTHFDFEGNNITRVHASDTKNNIQKTFAADAVIAGADYHFVETTLLPPALRSYSNAYWQGRRMSPSCLLYFVGLNKKLPGLQHHNLFFDTDFEQHSHQLFTKPGWPQQPLFYVCAPSVTDASVAPANCENLFFLIPIAAGLYGDTAEQREAYFEKILQRFETKTGHHMSDSIVVKRNYGLQNFSADYGAFKGNAYGLANTLLQTALGKPAIKSKKIKNLYYTGQLTVPGPGVPPALISGEVVAGQVIKEWGNL